MESEELINEASILVDAVSKAFETVVLGNGVGLFQAQAIDGHRLESEKAAARAKDEKNDWRLIPVQNLNKCYSSLHFFDSEGMRFHLPAYLTAYLKGECNFDLEFCLTHISEYTKEQFNLLNVQQREAIRGVLYYMFNICPESYFSADIVEALLGFWSEEND
jgi:hypothetical protein